ncbi:helix-turn-helix transcriptional regulator [Kitasatospora sp. SUK 42]|uniref:ArsR/SmtB family transcription factor n=1 Tax=Kitasatospora sp. SUK 42 TaxID=1588882 RepID=UPI0018C9D3E3|nr:helix-turn-helix transcriptional regulator [Kitasatospora sp. SUK 42]MBV2155024.1 ArsR family transcriptional regulator [Kitasatospora sp. SUK 42]
MLRIFFGTDDLDRLRVAERPDMSMELSLSVHALISGHRDPRFQAWRDRLRASWNPRTALLFDLYTPSAIPEFLAVRRDPGATESATAGAPEAPLRDHLRSVGGVRQLSAFARGVAAGDRRARKLLGNVTADYQTRAIDPYRRQIETIVTTEHGRRRRATEPDQVLGTLHPAISWRRPVLTLPLVGGCRHDLRLDGRGLLLQPCVFGARRPVIARFEDPEQQPVLLYPARINGPLLAEAEPTPSRTLTALLGQTRAAALEAVAGHGPCSTKDLAAHLGISTASASEHATVLADSGLTTKDRTGRSVTHRCTPLGRALLAGHLPALAPAAEGVSV